MKSVKEEEPKRWEASAFLESCHTALWSNTASSRQEARRHSPAFFQLSSKFLEKRCVWLFQTGTWNREYTLWLGLPGFLQGQKYSIWFKIRWGGEQQKRGKQEDTFSLLKHMFFRWTFPLWSDVLILPAERGYILDGHQMASLRKINWKQCK